MYSRNTVEQLKRHLRDVVEKTTEKSKGGLYVCPFCGSGTGPRKSGALSLDSKTLYTTWHCFACEAADNKPYHGDVFDYVGKLYNIPEFWARVKKAAEICGVHVEEEKIGLDDPAIGPLLRKYQPGQTAAGGATAPAQATSAAASAGRGQADTLPAAAPAAQEQGENGQKGDNAGMTDSAISGKVAAPEAEKPTGQEAQAERAQADYTEFFKQAAWNLDEIQDEELYLKITRGISRDTCRRFNVGYAPDWKHPNAPEFVQASQRLIIPTSSESYLARDLRKDTEIPEQAQRFKKQKTGVAHLFNADALKSAADKPTVITEAEIDALSMYDAGGGAVNVCALGSTSMKKRAAALIKQYKPKQPIIIAMDNDGAGKAAAEYLERVCEYEGVFSLKADEAKLYGGKKDANEALQADRDALTAQILALVDEAREQQQTDADAEQEELIDKISIAAAFPRFFGKVLEGGGKPRIPTGFPCFDKVTNGGIYAGLIIIGALSSLGKTTYVMQVADQIARSGRDVLVISLEMSQDELMAKSISRHTAEIVYRDETLPHYYRRNALDIMDGSKYKEWAEHERGKYETILKAMGEYKEYAVPHLYIYEAEGSISAAKVRDIVQALTKAKGGRAPVVIVDYLQILVATDPRLTDKQKVDQSVVELRQVARDYNTPVICVSSFNRENYANTVSMACFKESGGIEYSSDILIGLQFTAASNRENWDENEEKRKVPREVQLVILKNRFGRVGVKLEYRFFSEFNLWIELPEDEQPDLTNNYREQTSQPEAADSSGAESANADKAAAARNRKKRKRTASEIVAESQEQARADKQIMGADFLAENV